MYHTDARVVAARAGDWFTALDTDRMLATITWVDDEGYETDAQVAVKWAVCSLCNGRGSHVNPSIDSHGLSADDFAMDPDFADDYCSGVYDQPCNECHGRTTVPEPVDEADPVVVAMWERQADARQDDYDDARQRWMESGGGY